MKVQLKGGGFNLDGFVFHSVATRYPIYPNTTETDNSFRLIKLTIEREYKMSIEKQVKTMVNTLALLGLEELEFEVKPLTRWEGIGVKLKDTHQGTNVIRIMVTDYYCGCTSKLTGAITVMHEEGKSMQDSLDTLLERIVAKLEGVKEPEEIVSPDSYDLKTVTIPEGTFEFKGNDSHVEKFDMCETCVTWDDWEKYIAANPDKDIPNDDAGFGRGKHPVVNISWLDIQDYIEWLNKVTGDTYALPTEEQWEYACRGGTTTDYYTGDSIDITQANFFTDDVSIGQTTPVGSYPPNPFGLLDCHGNC